jgi:hypothetical protein
MGLCFGDQPFGAGSDRCADHPGVSYLRRIFFPRLEMLLDFVFGLFRTLILRYHEWQHLHPFYPNPSLLIR